jgi:hypothetical protein
MEDKRSRQISDLRFPELPTETPPTAEEKATKRHVDRILRRVGYSDEAWCKWLLNFAHASFSELGVREKALLSREVPVFLYDQTTKQAPRNIFAWRATYWLLEEVSQGEFPQLALPETDLGRIHRWLKDGVAKIEAGDMLDFRFPVESHLSLTRHLFDGEKLVRRSYLASYEFESTLFELDERFAVRVYEALKSSGQAISGCVDCHTLFVADHGRQAYCSERCSQRVRTRKWRKRNPEKTRARRRQQYLADNPEIATHVRKKAWHESQFKGV